MKWIVLGCFVLGIVLCGLAWLSERSNDPDVRSGSAFPARLGFLLIFAAVVLAIGNAAVKALL